jgi:hypothetical protein
VKPFGRLAKVRGEPPVPGTAAAAEQIPQIHVVSLQ